ncbi:MAG: TatD family hydrolase [Saprospiraceae bacterium]|nr:TatD family hydrolase [Saprospiraceae bacterium]
MIDTHAHIYLDDFQADRTDMMRRLTEAGVQHVYLPNIDLDSISKIRHLVSEYPDMCSGMMGLHPCSVKEDWQEVLNVIKAELDSGAYTAVGEIGLDGYWDPGSLPLQEEALRVQIRWAVEARLPIVLHTRDTMDRVIEILTEEWRPGLSGIFHCFNGTTEQARRIIDLGFFLGIGGVYTFKTANMADHLAPITLDHMVLETDSPYLAPVPYRGRRNEPAYLAAIAARLAEDRHISVEEVVLKTTRNARIVFQQNNE